MIIKPLGKSRFKPVVLLVPGWRRLTAYTPTGIKTVSGAKNCLSLLESLEMTNLYVSHSLRELLNATGAANWEASLWKGHVTTLRLDGTKVRVHSLRRLLDEIESDEEKYKALNELTQWLEIRGVAPASISGMAWSLWRSTLYNEIEIGFNSKVGRSALYGGRQEAVISEELTDMVAVDMSSAYPYEMANRPYAGTLREVGKTTILDPNQAGIASATVYVPEYLPHAPLPVRLGNESIYWPKGKIEGTWTWQELAAADSLGCEIEVTQCFAPLDEIEPFGAWWDVVREARASMSPGGAKLVKALSNSLWGLFAMTGDNSGTLRWSDDHGTKAVSVDAKRKKLPQSNAAHLAAETTSRVRSRMLLEGLYGGEDLEANNPAHIDTDGVIIPKKALSRFSKYMIGNQPGQWRVKQEIARLEVRGPQLYRFTCSPDCLHGWHYVASGMTARQAADFFDRPQTGLKISLNSNLPQTDNQIEKELLKLS